MGDQHQEPAARPGSTLARLEAHLPLHTDPQNAPYVKVADVVHRLNDVLGLAGWRHTVLRDGFDEATDHLWVYGQMAGTIDGEPFVREAYGAKKVTRGKQASNTGLAIQWGDDWMAAQSYSLKKCAKQLGIGGFVDDPEEVAAIRRQQQGARQAPPPAARTAAVDRETGEVLVCADCGEPLSATRMWSAVELARRSRERFEGVLYCITDYTKRSQARARDTASRIPALRTGAEQFPGEGG